MTEDHFEKVLQLVLKNLFMTEFFEKHKEKLTKAEWRDPMKHYLQKIMVISQHASVADAKHFGPNFYGQQFRSVVVKANSHMLVGSNYLSDVEMKALMVKM